MKMTAAQQKMVENKFGVEAVPEEHPVHDKLTQAFGDHTFLLDAEGLNIVEPNPSPEQSTGTVVRLATWSEDRKSLQAHQPQVLPVTVDLEVEE